MTGHARRECILCLALQDCPAGVTGKMQGRQASETQKASCLKSPSLTNRGVLDSKG
ncbi:hypothetical protein C1G86_1115 [Dehalococcoides mccartyi]|uniref:Uncharacterized protein n=1 Tax=Dehalococcoides mccartyi TaxID=61435 RepID=A0A328EM38_9CHLR|nr:hypothetical protein C1G87_1080 [Dehalococcoides mccartyi]RAL70241.1 hypothetical protein C1G86_1115 [Dehalococcoides mccartyi]